MKDVLHFSIYVERILNARAEKNERQERLFGKLGNELFDLFYTGGYDPDIGESIPEKTFADCVLSECRQNIGGFDSMHGYLMGIRRYAEIQIPKISDYLGKPSPEGCEPAWNYMWDCRQSLKYYLRESYKLSQEYFPDEHDSAPTLLEDDDEDNAARKSEMQNRPALFNRKYDIAPSKFKPIVERMIQAGILEKDGDVKEKQRLLKIFLIGAGSDYREGFSSKYLHVAKLQNLSFFLSCLDNEVRKKDIDMCRPGGLWSRSAPWFWGGRKNDVVTHRSLGNSLEHNRAQEIADLAKDTARLITGGTIP